SATWASWTASAAAWPRNWAFRSRSSRRAGSRRSSPTFPSVSRSSTNSSRWTGCASSISGINLEADDGGARRQDGWSRASARGLSQRAGSDPRQRAHRAEERSDPRARCGEPAAAGGDPQQGAGGAGTAPRAGTGAGRSARGAGVHRPRPAQASAHSLAPAELLFEQVDRKAHLAAFQEAVRSDPIFVRLKSLAEKP